MQTWSSAAPGAVNARIRALRPQLSATMAKIADVLLTDPQAPLHHSISELAARTATSPASITRFCRELGYAGYVPFRVAVAQEVGRNTAWTTWTTDIGAEFGPESSPQAVLSTLLNAHSRSLAETASVLDLTLLRELARRIATARHVDLYGLGGSGRLAAEMQARLYRIDVNVHSWLELHDGLASAAIQDTDCVAVAISSTGRTEGVIEMLRTAGAAGALTVAITSQPATPLAAVADHTIATLAHERFMQPDDLTGRHVQLLVLDLLYLLVAQESFTRSTTTLAATAAAVAPHRRPLRSVSGDPSTSRSRVQPNHRKESTS